METSTLPPACAGATSEPENRCAGDGCTGGQISGGHAASAGGCDAGGPVLGGGGGGAAVEAGLHTAPASCERSRDPRAHSDAHSCSITVDSLWPIADAA